jgi:hypothetical protein
MRMESSNNGSLYEVLSPWAEADLVPLSGISPRLEDMAGKKIGLFCNSKRAARLMLTSIENKLRERFPSVGTSWYDSTIPNVPEIESANKEKFIEWVMGVDAVILAVGD